MRILLVEDDPMIGDSLRQGLRAEGFTVDWVQDGSSAERALETTVYALVLLDLGLPRKDGLAVLGGWRRRGLTLRLDPAAHTLEYQGQPVALSAREFTLLHALMEQPGMVLSREQLEDRLYGWAEIQCTFWDADDDPEVITDAYEVAAWSIGVLEQVAAAS